jgi:hypothetical protein
VQKKTSGNFYGLLTYSYSIAESENPEWGTYNSDYDYRNIFTAIGGYKISNKWEFSTKWRYSGGLPYTPTTGRGYDPISQKWYAIKGKPNSERYPSYHRLDFRVDRRFIFKIYGISITGKTFTGTFGTRNTKKKELFINSV